MGEKIVLAILVVIKNSVFTIAKKCCNLPEHQGGNPASLKLDEKPLCPDFVKSFLQVSPGTMQCSYQGVSCRVVLGGQLSDHFEVKTGVHHCSSSHLWLTGS